MAVCNKAVVIKAVLFAGFLLITFNLFNNHIDNHPIESFYFSKSSDSDWPTIRSKLQSSVTSNISAHNVYTILLDSENNNTLKHVRFNVPDNENVITNNTSNGIINKNHSNSMLLVDSTDFKRKFPKHKNTLNDINVGDNKINHRKNIQNLENDNLISESHNQNESQTKYLQNNAQNIKNKNNNSDNNDINENYESSTAGKLLKAVMSKLGLKKQPCPFVPPDLDGPIEVNTTMEQLEDIEKRFSKQLKSGGIYKPIECEARDHVAIIIPFRDRYAHLPIFLKNIHPFLMKQQIHYGIYLVEQTNGKPFNRAALMNVGFLEAIKQFKWDCFIFHDVDLLPLDGRNLYTCPDQPRHMSVAIDIFGYKLPYTSIFGGVSAMTTSQFQKVNGFSNSFWGWGGEDDDMSNRLKHANFHISRYPINVARYMMLNHQKEKANPKRFENLVNGAKRFDVDGLNSVKYQIYSSKKFPLFTWFLVELKLPEQR